MSCSRETSYKYHTKQDEKSTFICNCYLEAESNFLLESLATCENPETKADLVMYFTVNLAL